MTIAVTLFARRAGLLAGLLLGLAIAVRAQGPSWQTILTAAPLNASSGALVSASATDASGNVYVAGSFTGSISLGGITYTSGGTQGAFVAKWRPATQSFAWVQQSQGTNLQAITALAVSGSQVYLAGTLYGTASFGTTTLTSAGSGDGFVAKLTDAGSSATFVWAQRMGGPAYDGAMGLAVSGSAVYVAGLVNDTASFGGTSYTSAGTTDGFVAKLIDAGSSATFAWTQLVGGPSADHATGLAVQGTTLYVAGLFTGAVAFGPLSQNSGSASGLFVAKLTDAGPGPVYTWVQQATGAGIVLPNALVAQGGQVYVAGRFQGAAAFGSSSLANASTSSQAYDVFVTKLADAGTTASFVWAYRAGGPLSDYASALAVQGTAVYVAGGFGGVATFGSTAITSTGTSEDAFVTRLTDAGGTASFAWALGGGGTQTDNATALATTGSAVYVSGWVIDAGTFGSQSIGSANSGQTGFFAALPDAATLAVAQATTPAAYVALFPTPTPSGTLATVQLPAASAATTVGLTLLDALGRVVRTRTVALPAGTATTTFDVAGLAPGVYALRVATGERLGTARLVVE